jgi:hypothetical protein
MRIKILQFKEEHTEIALLTFVVISQEKWRTIWGVFPNREECYVNNMNTFRFDNEKSLVFSEGEQNEND